MEGKKEGREREKGNIQNCMNMETHMKMYKMQLKSYFRGKFIVLSANIRKEQS